MMYGGSKNKTAAFYSSLTRDPKERSEEDVTLIYNYLRTLEVFERLNDTPLRSVCRTARLERHAPNHMLFRKGQVATCWYILLTGSVYMNKQVYLPVGCFGKRSNMNLRRNSDCIVIQPSDMIVIDYPDVQRIPVSSTPHHLPAQLPPFAGFPQPQPPLLPSPPHHLQRQSYINQPHPSTHHPTASAPSNHFHVSHNSVQQHVQRLNAASNAGRPTAAASSGSDEPKFRKPAYHRIPSPAPPANPTPTATSDVWVNSAYQFVAPFPPPKPPFMRRAPYPCVNEIQASSSTASTSTLANNHRQSSSTTPGASSAAIFHARAGSSGGSVSNSLGRTNGRAATPGTPSLLPSYPLTTSASAVSVPAKLAGNPQSSTPQNNKPPLMLNNFHAAIYHNSSRAPHHQGDSSNSRPSGSNLPLLQQGAPRTLKTKGTSPPSPAPQASTTTGGGGGMRDLEGRASLLHHTEADPASHNLNFQRQSKLRINLASRRESEDSGSSSGAVVKMRPPAAPTENNGSSGMPKYHHTGGRVAGGGSGRFIRNVAKGHDTASTSSASNATSPTARTMPMMGLMGADEFAGLPETAVDLSDGEDDEDEDESCPSHDSFQELRDSVRECLEKEPRLRTADDIAVLMDFFQQMQALSTLPMSIKRQLCLKMLFAVVPHAGTEIMKHGEIIDAWSVVVNGCVEWVQPNGERVEYRVGECFGVSPDPTPQYQEGLLRTTVDDCEFVLVERNDYHQIMATMGEHIEREADRVTGEVVREAERRIIGTQVELLVTKALPDRLIRHLVDDSLSESSPTPLLDSHYVEDFLLVYRVFIVEPRRIVDKLALWFDEEERLRDRVARVMLLWVNNHFNDFEMDKEMAKYLDTFDSLLESAAMFNQQSLLNITRSVKSRPRTITITRSNRDQELPFTLVGEPAHGGVFIERLNTEAPIDKNGLCMGDEVLEVNGQKVRGMHSLDRTLELMKGSTHLSLLVKSNLIGHRQMLLAQEQGMESPQQGDDEADSTAATMPIHHPQGGLYKPASDAATSSSNGTVGRYQKRSQPAAAAPNLRRSTLNTLDMPKMSAPCRVGQGGDNPSIGGASGGSAASSGSSSMFGKLKTMLMKGGGGATQHLPIHERQFSGESYGAPTMMADEEEAGLAGTSLGSSAALRTSRSNPDISVHQCKASTSSSLAPNASIIDHRRSSLAMMTGGGGQQQVGGVGEQAVKVYKADQSYRYLTVYPETTAQNIVQLALHEFGMTSTNADTALLDWSLCECSVTREGVIKQRRLPPDMANLAERVALNSRLYLKSNTKSETLIPDELASEVLKEARISLYALNAQFIAVQLTLQDFHVFASIEPTEYVNNLFQLETRDGWPQLALFEALFNREMWWVVTEVCFERNVYRRAKLIKKFIKIARQCRDLRNFNSMFAIMSGLEKPAVRRLTHSWDRVPGKHLKMFTDMQQLLDPSRNMSRYRQHLAQVALEPPVIPIYPVLRKDLTFAHEANPTFCGKLVNFEKLRMIARIVRSVMRLSAVNYDVDLVSSSNQPGGGAGVTLDGLAMMGAAATIRRMGTAATLTQSSKAVISGYSRKKLYERTLMLRKVKAYLANMPYLEDEAELDRLSLECEPCPPAMGGAGYSQTPSSNGGPGSSSQQSSRRRMPSPSPSSLSSHSTQSVDHKNRIIRHPPQQQQLPKFGVESPQAAQKMLALAENTKVKTLVSAGDKSHGQAAIYQPSAIPVAGTNPMKRVPSFGRSVTQATLPQLETKRNSLAETKR